MDRSLIKSLMPSLVAAHVPRNARGFKYRVFDDQPQVSAFGFSIDPDAFDGKVVANTGDAIIVRVKPTEFAVLDPNLVTSVPEEGAKVHVQPYATPAERQETHDWNADNGYCTHGIELGCCPAGCGS